MESKLEQAARHVERGSQIVAEQRQRIIGLKEKGLDTAAAEHLLGQFEKSLGIFRADLEELKRKLGID